jgi:hypothetical protein
MSNIFATKFFIEEKITFRVLFAIIFKKRKNQFPKIFSKRLFPYDLSSKIVHFLSIFSDNF